MTTPSKWPNHLNMAAEFKVLAGRKAWPLFGTLEHPMQKARLAMFIVTETHPFTDGNGRTARLLMNCFLLQQAQCRIIVPTVFREDYLLALKALSHQSDGMPYVRAMRLCQAWSSELDYGDDVPTINSQLDRCWAKAEDTRSHRLLSPRTSRPTRVPE